MGTKIIKYKTRLKIQKCIKYIYFYVIKIMLTYEDIWVIYNEKWIHRIS